MLAYLSLNNFMESMGADNVGELIGMFLAEALLIFIIAFVFMIFKNRKKHK